MDEERESRARNRSRSRSRSRSVSPATRQSRTMVLHVPKSKQYLLIGKEGAAIRALERDFECRVDVPTAEDQARTVIVRGSVANVLAAHRRMQQLTGMRLGETPLSIAHLTIPHGAHGALIGRQGAKLRELEERFNCDIAIPKRESNCDEVVAEGLVPDLQALREELSLMLQQQVLMQVSTPTEEVESSDLMDELKCDPATILRRPLVDLTAVFDEVICFGPSLQSDDVSAFGIDRFFDVLRSAKVSLDISVFTLSDTRIANIVEDAFNSGIAVRIITDGRTYRDKGSDIAQLSRSGIPVHIHTTEGHMHTKFVIVDRLVTMSGSMNWTLSANHSNFEHVVISSSKQLVVGFQSFFDTMWADSNHFVDFPK